MIEWDAVATALWLLLAILMYLAWFLWEQLKNKKEENG